MASRSSITGLILTGTLAAALLATWWVGQETALIPAGSLELQLPIDLEPGGEPEAQLAQPGEGLASSREVRQGGGREAIAAAVRKQGTDPARLLVEIHDSGQPVAGALVSLPEDLEATCTGQGPDVQSPHAGTTDDRGRVAFQVPCLRLTHVRFEVLVRGRSVGGHKSVSTPAKGGSKLVRFDVSAFDESLLRTVQVVSSMDGEPLAGAEVFVRRDSRRVGTSVVTDATGRARLPGKVHDEVRASMDGFGRGSTIITSGDEVQLIQLHPDASIRGVVSLPDDFFPVTVQLAVKDPTRTMSPDNGFQAAQDQLTLQGPGPWTISDLPIPQRAAALQAAVWFQTTKGAVQGTEWISLQPGEQKDVGDPWTAIDLVEADVRYPSGMTPARPAALNVAFPSGISLQIRGYAGGARILAPMHEGELSVRGSALARPVATGEGGALLELSGLDAIAGSVKGAERRRARVYGLSSALPGDTWPIAETTVRRGRFQLDYLPMGTALHLVVQPSARHQEERQQRMLDTSIPTAAPLLVLPGTSDVELELVE